MRVQDLGRLRPMRDNGAAAKVALAAAGKRGSGVARQ